MQLLPQETPLPSWSAGVSLLTSSSQKISDLQSPNDISRPYLQDVWHSIQTSSVSLWIYGNVNSIEDQNVSLQMMQTQGVIPVRTHGALHQHRHRLLILPCCRSHGSQRPAGRRGHQSCCSWRQPGNFCHHHCRHLPAAGSIRCWALQVRLFCRVSLFVLTVVGAL